MLHIVKLIEGRYPKQANPLITGLVVTSAVTLLGGVCLLLVRTFAY